MFTFILYNLIMATGFRPKYERTIELAGYSAEELMLLAIEASKSLGWQAGSIKRDKSDFIRLQVLDRGKKRLFFL